MATVVVNDDFQSGSNVDLELWTTNTTWTRSGGTNTSARVFSSGNLRANPQLGAVLYTDSSATTGGFVEATLNGAPANIDWVLVIRGVDSANYVGWKVGGTATDTSELVEVVAGVETSLFTLTRTAGETYRLEDDGSNLTLFSGSVNGEGGTQVGTVANTTHNTATGKGFGSQSGTVSGEEIFTQYKSGTLGSPPQTINIDTPQYTSRQRDGSDQALIPVTGSIDVSAPTNIEYSVDGTNWTVGATNANTGAYNFNATVPTGQHTLQVRLASDTAVTASVSDITVGDVFPGCGQSDMSGRMTNLQTYTHASLKAILLGNDDVFKELSDPTDSNTNQTDLVSSDGASGSFIVRFIHHYMDQTGVPVIYIPCAKGGSKIAEWQKTSVDRVGTPALNLYESMDRRIQLVGGSIKDVIWHQGHADSKNTTDASAYQAALESFANDINTDYGCGVFVIPLQTLNYVTYDFQDEVRAATIAAGNANANITVSDPNTDFDADAGAGDGAHILQDADGELIAKRAADFYNGSDTTISITGIPDGTYRINFCHRDTGAQIAQYDLQFTGGSATKRIPTPSATPFIYYIVDNINNVTKSDCNDGVTT